MINKIKGIVNSSQEIQKIRESLQGLTSAVDGHSNQVQNLQKNVNLLSGIVHSIHQDNVKAISNLSHDFSQISALRKELETEINELRILRNSMEKNVSTSISTHIENSLGTQLDRLKSDVKSYNELKSSLQSLQEHLRSVATEVSRLKNMSSVLKESDVQMSKMAKEVLLQDRHKLDLMKQVDELERLISKERRRR